MSTTSRQSIFLAQICNFLIFFVGIYSAQNVHSRSAAKSHLPGIQVVPLVEGQMVREPDGQKFIKVSSVTLVYGEGIVLVVDSAAATDFVSSEQVLRGLSTLNISHVDVRFVVTTHGHPDHFGQANFYPNADHFFGAYQNHGNSYKQTQLRNTNQMKLSEKVALWSTPGHTTDDISVVVSGVEGLGTVGIVGDLFYSELDALSNGTDWSLEALNPYLGYHSRMKMICSVNYIVPGHSRIFRVTEGMKEAAKCPTQIANNELTNGIYHRLASLMASARDEPLRAGLTNYTQLNSKAYIQAMDALKKMEGHLQQSKISSYPVADYFVSSSSAGTNPTFLHNPHYAHYLMAAQPGAPIPVPYLTAAEVRTQPAHKRH